MHTVHHFGARAPKKRTQYITFGASPKLHTVLYFGSSGAKKCNPYEAFSTWDREKCIQYSRFWARVQTVQRFCYSDGCGRPFRCRGVRVGATWGPTWGATWGATCRICVFLEEITVSPPFPSPLPKGPCVGWGGRRSPCRISVSLGRDADPTHRAGPGPRARGPGPGPRARGPGPGPRARARDTERKATL